MHIVFVHRGVYPERIGGTYSYIYELGRRLAVRGHTVRVIASTGEREAPAPYEHEGMLIHKYAFRRVNPLASTAQHLGNTTRLFRSIHAEQPVDILTIHDSQLGWSLSGSELGRSVCQLPTFHAPLFLEFRLRVKWMLEEELAGPRGLPLRLVAGPSERWQRRLEDGILRNANGIHVLSRYSLSHIENHFPEVDPAKVSVIPGGVDASRFEPSSDRAALRGRLGIGEDTLEVLTVRNLSPRMGLENLVRATRMVLDADPLPGRRLHVTICGEGALRRALEGLISELGLGEHVTLAGRVTDDALVEHYQAADLFVLPTAAMEGFGISTVEALAANLPVIGTPAGATPEILTSIDERLVTRDTSAEAIADAVLSWLEWRADLAGTSRYRDEVLARYEWDIVADRMERWYASELATFRSSAG